MTIKSNVARIGEIPFFDLKMLLIIRLLLCPKTLRLQYLTRMKLQYVLYITVLFGIKMYNT